ncbi:MAG: glycerol-3-phosphate dehydrogenase [Alphaproteobacteria bacterium]|nr:glycerol-3-phosphate dehydrogenase [Alphaproteobacteria bacterium]
MVAETYDLLVIGGGINGAGIARDAAGRGLSVLLVERDDLAAHTSSASTKLIHGGLRYLEYYEFRLVREALQERERLLEIAPHLIAPLRFVLPLPEGGRPGWMIRLGLWLYDHLGGRVSLPGSRTVRLTDPGFAGGLKPSIVKAFTYSDCRVDDARLVVANAMDAAARGATILTGVAATGARPVEGMWEVDLAANPERPAPLRAPPGQVRARALVNAAGPWVSSMLGEIGEVRRDGRVRLVKGSHIVVPRRYEGDHAFLFQNPDGRIMFTIPYQQGFTLIGTTDVVVGEDERAKPAISDAEIDYLVAGANDYLANPVSRAEIVWAYSGVRPLFDDGRADAKAITRDYVLKLGRDSVPQVLSVFGGKLTTYRRLAEHALDDLKPWLAPMGPGWTDEQALPGGDIPGGDKDELLRDVQERWPFLGLAQAERLAHAYGSRVERVLGAARDWPGLGEDFGAGLTAAEVDYLCGHEWARSAEDILWRRTKLGLVCPPGTTERLEAYLQGRGQG